MKVISKISLYFLASCCLVACNILTPDSEKSIDSNFHPGIPGSRNTPGSSCLGKELNSCWTPQWENLIAYWKMDNDWLDSKGTKNGTPVDDPTFSLNGKIGTHAASFDGSGMRVTFSDSGLPDGEDPRTLMMWIKTTSTNVIPLNYGDSSSGQNYLGVYNLGSGNQNAIIGTGNNLSGTSSINDNNWHHIVGTYDGTTWKIYVDGVFENSDSAFNAGTVLGGILSVGAAMDASQAVNGLIDDVAIWGIDLTASEISQIYDRQSLGTF